MEFMWLYTLCQCVLNLCTIVVSVRLCVAVSGRRTVAGLQGRTPSDVPPPGSVSCCLHLCLGWMGVVGGALGIPVTVVLNLRSHQCLYTCITLVCCPLLVRQFIMFLLMLLTLDAHLHHHSADRYSLVMTRQRALWVVLICWVGSVLTSFAQFIGSDVLHTYSIGGSDPDSETAGLGLGNNWTTSVPHPTPSKSPKYLQDRKVIGEYLPYGGFLSKFYVEDRHNFTYAEIHGAHWGVCAPDTLLSPEFLVYAHGLMVFVLPLLCLLAIYLHLLCMKPRKTLFSHVEPPNLDSCQVRSLALSVSLLVLLCLPLHTIHALLLFTPTTHVPPWAHALATFLFQLYGLVPQLLFTPARKQIGKEQASFPLPVPNLPLPVVAPSGCKTVPKSLCEALQAAPWCPAKHSLKAKVCPEV